MTRSTLEIRAYPVGLPNYVGDRHEIKSMRDGGRGHWMLRLLLPLL